MKLISFTAAVAIGLTPAAGLAETMTCDRKVWLETLKYCGPSAHGCRGNVYRELLGIDKYSPKNAETFVCGYGYGPYR